MSIVINDGKDKPTKLKYTGYPKRPGAQPNFLPVGPYTRTRHPPAEQPGEAAPPPVTSVHYGFEVIYPAGGPCPLKAMQYVKSTVSYTSFEPARGDQTSTIAYPAGDPTATPPVVAGFDGPSFANDGPPGGPNVTGRVCTADGADNGYYDGPGLDVIGGKSLQHAPASYDAAFLIVLTDCHDNVVETLSFEIHIAVDAAGHVIKNERTKEAKPAFAPDKPIGQSGLPIK